MVIQYGYMTLFASAFPLAATIRSGLRSFNTLLLLLLLLPLLLLLLQLKLLLLPLLLSNGHGFVWFLVLSRLHTCHVYSLPNRASAFLSSGVGLSPAGGAVLKAWLVLARKNSHVSSSEPTI